MQEWNRAIELIEADLASPIDVGHLAQVALTSDVAIRYGYGSAEAFTRAFKAMHGITPSQARRPGAELHSQPQLRFHLRIEGSADMKHRIVKKDAFRIIGLKTRVRLIYEGPNPEIVEFERSLDPTVRPQLAKLSGTEPFGLLAVTENIEEPGTEGSELDYWRGAASSHTAPDGYDSTDIPAGLWVVFETEGKFPEALQHLWADAAAEWFPANPYRWAPGPQLLLSVQPEPDGSKGRGQLWIPIEADTTPPDSFIWGKSVPVVVPKLDGGAANQSCDLAAIFR